MPEKPLGIKAYGSIPHLPNSRRGPADKGATAGQARIATERVRDSRDLVIVQEKLDGSCVAVAKLDDGQLVTLTRSGNLARSSRHLQHRLFDLWVHREENYVRFDALLRRGERAVGEWLLQAHGTLYSIDRHNDLFVLFDIMTDHSRLPHMELIERQESRLGSATFRTPGLLSFGPPMTAEEAMRRLGSMGFHNAVDGPEGAVWRVERGGEVDFLTKFVRHDKQDGCYLETDDERRPPLWNWDVHDI